MHVIFLLGVRSLITVAHHFLENEKKECAPRKSRGKPGSDIFKSPASSFGTVFWDLKSIFIPDHVPTWWEYRTLYHWLD